VRGRKTGTERWEEREIKGRKMAGRKMGEETEGRKKEITFGW
jgi:hypothetical protein